MKSIIALAGARDIEEFVEAQLRTDEFKRSFADRGGYIRHWVSRFAQVPRIFFDMSHPRIEHPHFYPWMGMFMKREYENDAVNDLFWLHEIAHAVMLEYDERTTHEAWLAKMVENELRTALESECMVYWEIPGLRARTFSFEIWADRFLERPMRSRDVLFVERRRAMNDPADKVEHEMACYPRQNAQWGEVWRDSWHRTERAMRELLESVERNDRQGGLERHMEWLNRDTGMTGDKPYPFPREAEEFAAIYWANKLAGKTQKTGNGSDRDTSSHCENATPGTSRGHLRLEAS